MQALREMLTRTVGVVTENQRLMGLQTTRVVELEQQLVDAKSESVRQRAADTELMRNVLMENDVHLPEVPNRGRGRNISKIKTKDLGKQKYDPSGGVPIEPFLRRFEDAVVALEERHDCVWDDRTCYRELQNSLLGAAELFISNEDLVKPEDQTYAKFRVRLARRFGKVVYTNKWQAAIALGDRVKKTEESYQEFAAALELIGGTHDIDGEHYNQCFKNGLNATDRAQLPNIKRFTLAQCVSMVQLANGHDGRDVPGATKKGMETSVNAVEPLSAEVLAANVSEQLMKKFPGLGRTPWKPNGAGRSNRPHGALSNNQKSKKNLLSHIKCFGCEENGHYQADCPKKLEIMVAALQGAGYTVEGNGLPDKE